MSDRAVDAASWQAFERKYVDKPDPWDFATSPYELGRYQAILGAVSSTNYGCIYEPGCSVGVLTQQLSRMAERVVATDFAPSAVEEARRRCAGLRNVDIEVADIRCHRPAPPPNLIVFSEIGYYFPLRELRSLGLFLAEQMAPDGELLAAHWLGHSKDHSLHGHEVHEQLRAVLPLAWVRGTCHDGFRIDCWRNWGRA
jgi:trans-aconitate methyltransferase